MSMIEHEEKFAEAHLAFTSGDFSVARAKFAQLAEENHPPSLFFCGFLLMRGLGTDQDLEGAKEWFQKGADAGEPACQDMLGRYSLEGFLGNVRQPAEAAHWFELASSQGFSPSQAQLGILQIQGKGVQQNLSSGFAWIRLAAEEDAALARSQLKILQRLLSAKEIDAATKIVKERQKKILANRKNNPIFGHESDPRRNKHVMIAIAVLSGVWIFHLLLTLL